MSFQPDTVSAVRLIKKQAAIIGLPNIHIDADFPVEILEGAEYFYELLDEYVFYIKHPPLNDVNVATIKVTFPEPIEILYVISEFERVLFEIKDDQIQFDLEVSKLTGRTRTLEVHTLIKEKGQTTRVEHNHPTKITGEYQSYPEIEIQAVLHYMAACRYVLKLSGIAEYISNEELGHFVLLGFETNNFTHPDYPPHWHIILRWPYRVGSQAPHIYVDASGKNIVNRISIDGIPKVGAEFYPGEWFKFTDMYGGKPLAIRITKQGGIEVTTDNHLIYEISAFDSENGVILSLNNHPINKIKVNDDSSSGIMETSITNMAEDEIQFNEIIHYDPLSGKINSLNRKKSTPIKKDM